MGFKRKDSGMHRIGMTAAVQFRFRVTKSFARRRHKHPFTCVFDPAIPPDWHESCTEKTNLAVPTIPEFWEDVFMTHSMHLRQWLLSIETKELAGAYLQGANLAARDLCSANLRAADLSCCDLTGARMASADLTCANLAIAEMSLADLSSANLAGANLFGADLYGANLSMANLEGAWLGGADLWDASLTGTLLSRAQYDRETRWPDGFLPESTGAVCINEAIIKPAQAIRQARATSQTRTPSRRLRKVVAR